MTKYSKRKSLILAITLASFHLFFACSSQIENISNTDSIITPGNYENYNDSQLLAELFFIGYGYTNMDSIINIVQLTRKTGDSLFDTTFNQELRYSAVFDSNDVLINGPERYYENKGNVNVSDSLVYWTFMGETTLSEIIVKFDRVAVIPEWESYDSLLTVWDVISKPGQCILYIYRTCAAPLDSCKICYMWNEAYFEQDVFATFDSIGNVVSLHLEFYDPIIFNFQYLDFISVKIDSIVPVEIFTDLANSPKILLSGGFTELPLEVIEYEGEVIFNHDVCASTLEQMGWFQEKYPEKEFKFCF